VTLLRAALLAVAAVLAGFSPFEREEENVRAGNALLREGDPAGARRRYDDAERAVGRRPEIEFDRGHAAFQERRPEEAEAAWRRSAEGAPGPLASRALQNVGTARAAAGDRAGAVRAFSDALAADPSNDDARWNLEVLLREEADPGGPQDGRRAPTPAPSPGGQDPRAAKGAEPEPAPPPQTPAAGEPGAPESGKDAKDEERRADGAEGRAKRAPRSRQEAEALLDALRAGEKDPPLFGRERRDRGRSDGAKDW
jgi:Ca-activated chloride channel family protein